jgi:hypothetical protein
MINIDKYLDGTDIPAPYVYEREHDIAPATKGDIEKLKNAIAEPFFMKEQPVKELERCFRAYFKIVKDDTLNPTVRNSLLNKLKYEINNNEDRLWSHPRAGKKLKPDVDQRKKSRRDVLSNLKETEDPTRHLYTPKTITDNVPQSRLTKTGELLEKIPGLKWTQKGHIVLGEKEINGSNIKDVLGFLQSKRQKREDFPQHGVPKGAEEMLNTIIDNDLQHLVERPSRHYEAEFSERWRKRKTPESHSRYSHIKRRRLNDYWETPKRRELPSSPPPPYVTPPLAPPTTTPFKTAKASLKKKTKKRKVITEDASSGTPYIRTRRGPVTKKKISFEAEPWIPM